jgi:hypothetical protein
MVFFCRTLDRFDAEFVGGDELVSTTTSGP